MFASNIIEHEVDGEGRVSDRSMTAGQPVAPGGRRPQVGKGEASEVGSLSSKGEAICQPESDNLKGLGR